MIEINTNDIDIMHECVDELTESQEDALLEREMLKERLVMRSNVPCDCFLCGDLVSETDLFWCIGASNQNVICLKCKKELGIS